MSVIDPRWYELRNAVYVKDFTAAADLLRQQPSLIHAVSFGMQETVLHFLAVENDLEGVTWLHAQGADINTKNRSGTSVLFEVASLGLKELYCWLVNHGADAQVLDGSGQNIVEYLLEYEKEEMAAWVNTFKPTQP